MRGRGRRRRRGVASASALGPVRLPSPLEARRPGLRELDEHQRPGRGRDGRTRSSTRTRATARSSSATTRASAASSPRTRSSSRPRRRSTGSAPTTEPRDPVWAETPPAADGTLDGSLYIVGDGDPTFGDAEVAALAGRDQGRGRQARDRQDPRRRHRLRPPPRPRQEPERAELLHRPAVGPLVRVRPRGTAVLVAARDRRRPGAAPGAAEPRRRSRRRRRLRQAPGRSSRRPSRSPRSARRTVAELVESTNEPSNNFFAEMLLKRLAVDAGTQGTTRPAPARSAPTPARSAPASAPRTAPASAARTRPRPSRSASCSPRCSTSPPPTSSTSRCPAPASRARSPTAWRAPPPRAAAAPRRARSAASRALSGYCDRARRPDRLLDPDERDRVELHGRAEPPGPDGRGDRALRRLAGALGFSAAGGQRRATDRGGCHARTCRQVHRRDPGADRRDRRSGQRGRGPTGGRRLDRLPAAL